MACYETTGAGVAMAMRTIPVLRQVIERMRRLCPDAWLVNFANPPGCWLKRPAALFAQRRDL
jgi:alpha-galactosidase/6-phospho-beta-glucosidase family protein